MNYGEIKTNFQARLNRRDVTATLVAIFIENSIRRVQRLLRVRHRETVQEYTVPADFERHTIPSDYQKLVSLCVDDGPSLPRVSLSRAIALASQGAGTAEGFCRDGDYFLIGPIPPEDSVITLTYVADWTALSGDGDTNWLTDEAPDVIIYGALQDACAHYSDPRKSEFEEMFIKGIVDLNNEDADEELTNATIMPTYSMVEDEG